MTVAVSADEEEENREKCDERGRTECQDEVISKLLGMLHFGVNG